MLHPELRLVPEEDRAIVECSDTMRDDVRRALRARLADLDTEIVRCRRRALEGRFRVTAAGLEGLRALVRVIGKGLEVEA